jgi:hypothetical protein
LPLIEADEHGPDPYDPEEKRPKEFGDQVHKFFAEQNIDSEMPSDAPL